MRGGGVRGRVWTRLGDAPDERGGAGAGQVGRCAPPTPPTEPTLDSILWRCGTSQVGRCALRWNAPMAAAQKHMPARETRSSARRPARSISSTATAVITTCTPMEVSRKCHRHLHTHISPYLPISPHISPYPSRAHHHLHTHDQQTARVWVVDASGLQSSEITRNHPKSPEITRGCPRLPEVARGCPRLPKAGRCSPAGWRQSRR